MIKGMGPRDARVALVFSEPGPGDLQRGRLNSGYLGGPVRDMLMRVGISYEDCYVTALFKDGSHALVQGGALSPAFLAAASELREELVRLSPNVVLCFGIGPLHALTGCGRVKKKGIVGVDDWAGSLQRVPDCEEIPTVIGTYEPEVLFRDKQRAALAANDMARAAKYSRLRGWEAPKYAILNDPAESERDAWWERAQARGTPVSFDIEFYNQTLLCVSFCNSPDEVLVVQHRGDSTLSFFKRVLESGFPLRAQNAAYDTSVLEWHYGIKCLPYVVFDTMLAMHTTYIELPKGLDTLCRIYTEQPCYWFDNDWKGIGVRWSLERIREYCARDSWVTHVVAEAQIAEELTEPGLQATFDFEMGLLRPLWEISARGVRFDAERMAAFRKDQERIATTGAVVLGALYPHLADSDGRFNVRGRKAMVGMLYDALGFKPSKGKAKTEKPADDMALSKFIAEAEDGGEDHVVEQLRIVRRTRRALNMLSKVVGSTVEDELADEEEGVEGGIRLGVDGRFRCTYNVGGTNTGRLSSNKFAPTGEGANGQNLPRGKVVRRFVRPDPGWLIAYNDLERAESLVVSILTQDPLMLKHHAPGVNGHRMLGELLFGVPAAELSEEQYFLSKQTRHAGSYMQGWKTFMDNVNKKADETGVYLTAAEAKRLNGLFREMHVMLPKWWNDTEYRIKQTGTLHNLFGRKRFFFDRTGKLPEAIAYVPQSTVGDTTNYGLMRLWQDAEAAEWCQMLMQVHDAIVYQVRMPDELVKDLEGMPHAEATRLATQHPVVRDRLVRVRNHLLVAVPDPRGGEFVINTETNASVDSWGECVKVSLDG